MNTGARDREQPQQQQPYTGTLFDIEPREAPAVESSDDALKQAGERSGSDTAAGVGRSADTDEDRSPVPQVGSEPVGPAAGGDSISSEEVLKSAAPGQSAAVRRLSAAAVDPVHAYMLVGPRGSGKRAAAAAFAGELLAAADRREGRGAGGVGRHRRLAAREQHPDVFVLEPQGNQLRRDAEAAALIAEMNRTPVEGDRNVLVVDRFHTATAAAAACLLKPIEEPVESAVWVLLAEAVPPEHATIASRCSRVDFATLADEDVSAVLTSEGLADEHRAALLAAASGGNLERARRLASDDQVEARHRAWRSVPGRLDGTGAAVAQLVEELRSLISDAGAPLEVRHKRELDEIAEREDKLGVRGSYARAARDRHRREQRQHRTDELRFGLAALARCYREHIAGEHGDRAMAAIDRLRATSAALARNPNEALALQALLLDLPVLSVSDRSR